MRISRTGEPMAGMLSGLRVIEGSAFVAAPSAGMTLAQMGADVIRFDPIGGGKGLFLTNFPAEGWLDYAKLKARRDDLIMVNILGNSDGSSAVDYTVNCATG